MLAKITNWKYFLLKKQLFVQYALVLHKSPFVNKKFPPSLPPLFSPHILETTLWLP